MTEPSITSALSTVYDLVQRSVDAIDDVTTARIAEVLQVREDIAWDSDFDPAVEGRRLSNEKALRLVDAYIRLLDLLEYGLPSTEVTLRAETAEARAVLLDVRSQIERQ